MFRVGAERGALGGDALDAVARLDEDDEDDDLEVTRTDAGPPKRTVVVEHPLVLVLGGAAAGTVHRLGEGELVVGRHPSSGLHLVDPGVSRRHCRFARARDGRFVVEDLGSTNGTWVAGERVHRAPLVGEERVWIGGDVVLRFALTDDTEEALARRLYEGATRDALTGCYSRRYFDDRFPAELAYARRHRCALSVLMVDVDHFKSVNDTLGHAGGDDVLRALAAGLQELVRTEDTLVRFGGEEFLLLVRGIEPPGLRDFAERVRASVERSPAEHRGAPVRVTVSVGVASLDECATQTLDALLALADARLYRAKRDGRNRVVDR